MTVMAEIIKYCKKTKDICVIYYKKVLTILSGLFAIEACYSIKKNNKKKNIMLPRQVTILST